MSSGLMTLEKGQKLKITLRLHRLLVRMKIRRGVLQLRIVADSSSVAQGTVNGREHVRRKVCEALRTRIGQNVFWSAALLLPLSVLISSHDIRC